MKFKFLPVLVLLAGWVGPARADAVIVSAAASLKDALTELAPLCLKQTGVNLLPNLAASGVLAAQIKSGAPVDIFISADDETMNGLEKSGLLLAGSRAKLLGNALVFVVPVDSKLKIAGPDDLRQDGVKHVGIGDPKTVPAGHYTSDYLTKLKILPDVQGKLVPLDNVRTVLSQVAAGNVEVGAVYHTDALVEKKVREVFAAIGPDAPVINYPIAVIKGTKAPAAAAKVREFLLSDGARPVFARYGFTLPDKPAAGKPAPEAGNATAPSNAPAAAPAK